MPRHIKLAALEGQHEEADAKIRSTVEAIIADVARRGEAAVRDCRRGSITGRPRRFVCQAKRRSTAASPAFRAQAIDDIRFAQTQIRHFARSSAPRCDVEVETMPGVVLGHKNIPSNRSAAMCRAGVSDGGVRAHERADRQSGGREAHDRLHAALNGEPHAATVAAMALGGADEIYVLGGVQAVAAMALGTETIAPVDMLVGPGNAYVAEAKRQLFGRVGIDLLAGPTETLMIADDTRTPRSARRSARPGGARADLAGDPGHHVAEARGGDDPRSTELACCPRRRSPGAWHDHGADHPVRYTTKWCTRPTGSPPSTSRC